MACGSGCCAPPDPEPKVTGNPEHVHPSKVSTSNEDEDSCCGNVDEKAASFSEDDHPPARTTAGCCGGRNNDGEPSQQSCSAPKPTIIPVTPGSPEMCGDDKASCCSSDEDETAHHAGNQTRTPKPGCQDGCCSSPSSQAQVENGSNKVRAKDDCCSRSEARAAPEAKGPSCCDENPSACSACDVDCLDRVALRECEKEKVKKAVSFDESSETTVIGSLPSSQCRGGEDGKPCDRHVRATRAVYANTMERLGCICRALLARGHESCCVDKERSASRTRKRSPSPFTTRSRHRASVDSCCASSASEPRKPSGGSTRLRHKHHHHLHSAASETNSLETSNGGHNVGNRLANSHSHDGSCCSSGAEAVSPTTSLADISTDVARVIDLESGFTNAERVVLSITGMTCSGCETKLSRTLSGLPSVKNLKTSLVMSRAEFDLDPRIGSVGDVLKHLERTTEFKCERLTNQGFSIDLMAPGDSTAFIKRQWPDGVTDMKALDKKVVQVAYDPRVVGARDLMESRWSHPVELAALRPDPTLAAGIRHVWYMAFMTGLSALLTIPVLVLSWAPLPNVPDIAKGAASLPLATIVQFVIAGPFYPTALKSLIFSRIIEMDLLIVLSTSIAFTFSVVSFTFMATGHPLSTGHFFETSTLLVTLIMVGRLLAAFARHRAVESISIRSLQTPTALLVGEPGGDDRVIDVRLLQYGDVFKVAPDSTIPTDGTIISGSSEVDESTITGESRPVAKFRGSPVIAGTINGSGTLTIRLTRLPGDNTINTIATMVDEAKLTKPTIQKAADRVASYFVPVVVVLTLITFFTWFGIGMAGRKQSAATAAIDAIPFAIAVLIVSCPCAIGLAVPMVIVIASHVAAKKGVIFKSPDSIEVAHRTSHVVLDKTGTLTNGKLAIIREEYLDSYNSDNAASLLLGLVDGIKHPVSITVATHLKAKGVSASRVKNAKALAGKGVEATTATGLVLRAGNSRWLDIAADSTVQSILSEGCTAFCFTINGSLAAVFGLKDSLRPDALATVQKLGERGIVVHIISGDDNGAVQSVGAQLGIPPSHVRSRCAPGDKKAYIQDILANPAFQRKSILTGKRKPPVVIFCGDGTNDAVALTQATVGVHMNEGTDVAKSAADVVLTGPHLEGILDAITMSKRAYNRILFNFGWCFVYNLFAIGFAAGVFVNVHLPPQYAGLGEVVSVVPVIIAAALLRVSFRSLLGLV
ncbi:E1-E2 ATPase-domain-containing protein [Apodospora peruviana]|uniref:E1-E2 ATPase-domain-containing protein n=1 Tax=Apodospora peruviana TaxID=516989 RepID=A0AAE0IDV1_9PEZI|nr:E1-E2 ATPase-domain-containing protein [Apodospora peruviana]